MESPVVVGKPPEYHGNAARNNERGFPFEEEEGSGAWSELAARHPDIAARLRQRPAAWARKRRPSSQDHTDDFGDDFGGFDRFPFDDIPPEFREHFPSRWNRRFSSRDESEPQPQPQQSPPQPPSPQQQTAATQTEQAAGPSHDHTYLPQYGLRNTVDLGQKSPADPSLVDAEERGQRSMSAPPDNRGNQNPPKMSDQNHHEQPHTEQSSNVRHIPIFVEGRDEPVINKKVEHAEPKPAYAPPPPHVDRDQYFADDGPVGFHAPPNFSRAFGTPFNTFRQGPQPFAQQKVYPQTAFARGASPQRSQSPKPNFPEEKFVKVPVHHEYSKGATPSKPKPAQQTQPPPQPRAHQPPPPQHKQHTPPRQEPPRHEPPRHEPPPQEPQPKPQPSANDPITQILSIQTDVLNLMTDVENFTGTKKDKKYMYLDEMLTRNLIKLDNIETEGKENIRQARKEAIKCIQKCIAVLEAKADNKNLSTPQPQEQPQEAPLDVEMKENSDATQEAAAPVTENGEVEMKELTKEEKTEPQPQPDQNDKPAEQNEKPAEEPKQNEKPAEQPKTEEQKVQPTPENKESEQPQAADTRPDDKVSEEAKTDEQKIEEAKKTTTKGKKKRDKSKDSSKTVDSNNEKVDKVEVMQVDDKGDKADSQTMEVDSAASQ